MHRWPYIWEDNENRVVFHTPGLHSERGVILTKMWKKNNFRTKSEMCKLFITFTLLVIVETTKLIYS